MAMKRNIPEEYMDFDYGFTGVSEDDYRKKQSEADLKVSEIERTTSQKLRDAQLEVNKVEAGHTSLFVAGWRPFIGWTCGVALCYHFVLQPFFTFLLYSFGYPMDLPQFDMSTLTTILLGMLGLGGMRSFEKVKKSV